MQNWPQFILVPKQLPLFKIYRGRVITKLLLVLLAAVFLATWEGELANMGQAAEQGYSKAQCLLHDADTENRRVKPSPFVGDVE